MPFELYQTTTGSRGSMAEVWIDRSAGLCKKFYKPTGNTIKGRPPLHQDEETITMLYNNEVRWSTCLRSEQVIRLYEHGPLRNEFGFYVLQEYVGPDLLYYYRTDTRLDHVIPDAAGQIISMFELFKQNNMYKLNNAMCNLTQKDGQIKAFDFKYASERSSELRRHEEHTIHAWISKIDPSLPDVLETYL